MTIDEVEKIKTVVENKDYIGQLVNTVAKTMIEAFENLKIEDVNMFQLGYNKAIDDFKKCEACAEENEKLADLLEELKLLKQWKSEVMDWLCKYDASSFEELVTNVRNKAIDDLRNELKNHYTEYDIDIVLEDANFYSYTTACNCLEDYIDEISEQLKAGESEKEEYAKKETNADRIRSMSDEELAMNMMCPNENGLGEINCDKSDSCNCYECLLKWLQSEVEE